MTNTTEKYVKYWEMETPETVQTTKNEIRFYTQHGKIQVYPKIKTNRGIGKGATINLDKFTETEVKVFTEKYTAISETEVFETNKSYWDFEKPFVMDTEANEIRFYVEHGKIQVFPKIQTGRGIGKGATINLDIPLSQRKVIDTLMFNALNGRNDVDFNDFEPVNNTEVAEVTETVEVTDKVDPSTDMADAFALFKKYNSMTEDDILNTVSENVFSDETTKKFLVHTFENNAFDVAYEIASTEIQALIKPYEIPYLFSYKVSDNEENLEVTVLIDRKHSFEIEELLANILESNREIFIDDEDLEESDEIAEEVAEIAEETEEINAEINQEYEEEVTDTQKPEAVISTKNITSLTDIEIKKQFHVMSQAKDSDFDPVLAAELFEELKKRLKR